MATFEFIASDEMRACLQRDAEELIACMRAGAWKAAHVIAGSLIQATLWDYLSGEGRLAGGAGGLGLAELLAVCREQGVLSQRTVDLAGFLRPYEEFLSPSEAVRTAAQADETSARIAQALLEIVINEVSARRRERFHYTADQAVAKVLSDPTSAAILGHLVTKISRAETERLLLESLPKAYFDAAKQDDGSDPAVLARLARCFRLAFDAAPEDLKRRVARRFVDVIENESEYVVQTYQVNFFSGGDMAFLGREQRALVLTHLLAVLQKRVTAPLARAVAGIGPYLEAEADVRGFFVPLVLGLLGGMNGEVRAEVGRRVLEEAARLSQANRTSIASWIGRLRWNLEKEGRGEDAARIASLLAALEAGRHSF